MLSIEHQIGHSLVLRLREILSKAETIAVALSIQAKHINQIEQLKLMTPELLDYRQDYSFAGGGIWFEPFIIDHSQQRFSFFWAKNPQEKLNMISDYNGPGPSYNEKQFLSDSAYKKDFLKSPGYQNEEWYIIAKYLPTKWKGFWSQSYTDPYSFEPMVTYSSPIKDHQQQFLGVATVDIKLHFLFELCRKWGELIGGKVFILDRNNKVISFFDQDQSRVMIQDESKNTVRDEYLHFKDVVQSIKDYTPILKELVRYDQKILMNHSSDKNLAKTIDESTYQMNEEESQRLVNYYHHDDNPVGDLRGGQLVGQVTLKLDPYIKNSSTAYIYIVPQTFWKVVVIFPQHLLNLVKNKPNQNLPYVMMIFMIFSTFLSILGWILWQKKEIKKRKR